MKFLLLAIMCSSTISIIMRLSSDRVRNNFGMLTMTYLMCSLIAAAHAGVGQLLPRDSGTPAALGLGVVQGVVFLAAFVLFQSNIKKNGIVLSSVFMKLGLLVPMVVSVFLFGELPSAMQLMGFAIALGAIVLINMKNGGSDVSSAFGLVLLLLAGGTGDCMSKVFEELGPAALADQFLFYTFAVALLLCVFISFFKCQHIGRSEVIYGCLVGIPNFYSSKFLLRALEELDAVIVYPSFSVATLLVVTLAGVLFFKERLKNIQWLAVGLILVALVLLNV